MGGNFNLRFDDTNPQKEDIEFANAIKEDMVFMGLIIVNKFFNMQNTLFKKTELMCVI